jgi:signal transduction histidine kinase
VGKLASGIAHELGTPLSVMTMEAKRIASGRATGEAAVESAQLVSLQGERMTRIIQQLLDFARQRPPRMGPVDLRDAVAGSAALLRPLAERRKIRVEIAAPEPVSVVADRARIEQVLTNVLVNGIQASPEGAALTVEVRRSERPPPGEAGEAAAWGRIAVVDHGPGIAPEVLPHIFEPFFTTKEPGQGTGLGLSVASGIVAEHGGFIDVESAVGAGARFAIHLPIAEPGVPAP